MAIVQTISIRITALMLLSSCSSAPDILWITGDIPYAVRQSQAIISIHGKLYQSCRSGNFPVAATLVELTDWKTNTKLSSAKTTADGSFGIRLPSVQALDFWTGRRLPMRRTSLSFLKKEVILRREPDLDVVFILPCRNPRERFYRHVALSTHYQDTTSSFLYNFSLEKTRYIKSLEHLDDELYNYLLRGFYLQKR